MLVENELCLACGVVQVLDEVLLVLFFNFLFESLCKIVTYHHFISHQCHCWLCISKRIGLSYFSHPSSMVLGNEHDPKIVPNK